jgi:hypothetical protein
MTLFKDCEVPVSGSARAEALRDADMRLRTSTPVRSGLGPTHNKLCHMELTRTSIPTALDACSLALPTKLTQREGGVHVPNDWACLRTYGFGRAKHSKY